VSHTLNYRPKSADPTPHPVREFIGRAALAGVGLILIWLAFRGFAFASVMNEAYRLDHPTATRKAGSPFGPLLSIASMLALALGGLVILGAILPSAAFWRLLTTDEPRTRRLRDAIPGPRFAYAVLHHTGVDPERYDILFETSPAAPLAAFRSPCWPLIIRTILERLPDHRRADLAGEDLVGNVRRVASGAADHRLWSHTHIMLALHPQDAAPDSKPSDSSAGTAVELYLTRLPDNTWIVATVGQIA